MIAGIACSYVLIALSDLASFLHVNLFRILWSCFLV